MPTTIPTIAPRIPPGGESKASAEDCDANAAENHRDERAALQLRLAIPAISRTPTKLRALTMRAVVIANGMIDEC